jgi:hypothetical protein
MQYTLKSFKLIIILIFFYKQHYVYLFFFAWYAQQPMAL